MDQEPHNLGNQEIIHSPCRLVPVTLRPRVNERRDLGGFNIDQATAFSM
jgi:hypothetical protein